MVVAKDGRQQYFIINLMPTTAGIFARRRWLLTLQETTDLVQSKRAVAWASMAQRLAHEIKTPLSSVMLAAQQLQMKLKPDLRPDDRRNKYIEHIINQVYRLRGTTDAFMKFAHLQQPNLQPADLNEIIAQCLNELSGIISPNIAIHEELTTELPTVRMDIDQIAIAIKNILENAVNAMEQEGVLTVTTRLVQSLLNVTAAEDAVVLEVSDTGCGIPGDQLSQIFEPFFSRSEGGTGLGLTLVKKIVQDHAGEIQVKSEIGIGTTVSISFPVRHF